MIDAVRTIGVLGLRLPRPADRPTVGDPIRQTEATMTDQSPPIHALVPVYVRHEHLPQVYELLAELMVDGYSQRSPNGNAVNVDKQQGDWFEDEFDELLVKI